MLKGGATGSLKHHTVAPGNPVTFNADLDFHFVYVATGRIALTAEASANAGDLIRLSKEAPLQLTGEGNIVEIRVTPT
jgi:hypothetical protein